jgi:hypothetical protein
MRGERRLAIRGMYRLVSRAFQFTQDDTRQVQRVLDHQYRCHVLSAPVHPVPPST